MAKEAIYSETIEEVNTSLKHRAGIIKSLKGLSSLPFIPVKMLLYRWKPFFGRNVVIVHGWGPVTWIPSRGVYSFIGVGGKQINQTQEDNGK